MSGKLLDHITIWRSLHASAPVRFAVLDRLSEMLCFRGFLRRLSMQILIKDERGTILGHP